jgi:hypothetical protein
MKCVPGNSTQLLYCQIFECLEKFWRTWPKFQNQKIKGGDTRVLTNPIRVLTKGGVVELLKVLMGECW